MNVGLLTPVALQALGASGAAILGVVGFATDRPGFLAETVPFLRLPLPTLSAPRFETWVAPGPVARCDRSGLQLAAGGGLLFGACIAREAEHGDLDALARSVYDRIFRLLADNDTLTLLRVFQYLPRITGASPEHGERYHAFNRGRHAAFAAAGRAARQAPAASALGLPAEALAAGEADAVHVYFVASAGPAMPVENARQVSAYAYPPRYGPKSPVFSRATIARSASAAPPWAHLLVSGTASIVGHASRHTEDPAAQTDEIFRNLDALTAACRAEGLAPAEAMRLKIYLRRAEDRDAVAARVGDAGGEALFLQADICRPELLVEIEATAPLRHL